MAPDGFALPGSLPMACITHLQLRCLVATLLGQYHLATQILSAFVQ